MRSNVIHLPGHAGPNPSTVQTEQEAVQAHQDASNALSMALHHLRSDNAAGAMRKAVQALAALKALRSTRAGSINAQRGWGV